MDPESTNPLVRLGGIIIAILTITLPLLIVL